MRSASSVTATIEAIEYASLTRIALNEKPSTPMTASAGPSPFCGTSRTADLVPMHEAEIRCGQDKRPECDPVPHERNEIVMGDVAQQPADHEECTDEGDGKTDGEHR